MNVPRDEKGRFSEGNEIKRLQARCPQCKEPLDDWAMLIYTKEKGKRYYCDECEMIVITKAPRAKPREYRRVEVM